MDCEKFEPLLIDELYGELDELTSAALKRHVSGCARCAASLQGMRATRRIAVLPLVALPAGLENRIMAAAREAQKVVPIKSRMSRMLSRAGNWAMRPQTAMAAVFLLMIGSSAVLLRSNRRPESAVSVTVAGTPLSSAAPVATQEAVDDRAAAAAHGPNAPRPITPPPPPAPAAMANKDSDGLNDDARDKKEEPQRDEAKVAKSDTEGYGAGAGYARKSMAANATAPAGAPRAAEDMPMMQQAAAPPAAKKPDVQDDFDLGTAAYRARNFPEATKRFAAAASNGDQNAALWAAKATRDDQGCAVALGKFVDIAQRAGGTYQGSEASLDAARCQMAMGQLDPARDRLRKLTQVPTHAAQATAALRDLDAIASRRNARPAAGAAAPAARAAPSPAKGANVSRPDDPAAEKRPSDSANSY